MQLADRFHLWQNLATAVKRLVAKHKGCLVEQPADPITDDAETIAESVGAMAQRRRAHHALVHDMLAEGPRLSGCQ